MRLSLQLELLSSCVASSMSWRCACQAADCRERLPSINLVLSCRQEQQVFNANGFDFKELEDGQVQLTAVPFSKEAVFGPQDVHELLHMLVHGEGQAFKMQTQQSTQHSQPSDSTQAAPRPFTKIVRPSRWAHSGHDCAGRYTLTAGLATMRSKQMHVMTKGPPDLRASFLMQKRCHLCIIIPVRAQHQGCCMQGAGHAGDARLSIIHHDRQSSKQDTNEVSACAPVSPRQSVELPSWAAHNEALAHLAAAMTHCTQCYRAESVPAWHQHIQHLRCQYLRL